MSDILKVVVASPGDVQPERDKVDVVITELNRTICPPHQVSLQLYRWETDTHPGFHPQGPQGLVDESLPIDNCDVLIGIFWKRFGTPVEDAGSGTEHEFLKAYCAWQKNRRPQIMFYFKQQAALPKTQAEVQQWGQVLAFRERFPKEGLWWSYRNKNDFERQVRQHLTLYLQKRFATPRAPRQRKASPSASATKKPQRPPALSPEAARQHYLTYLRRTCQALPLASLGADPSADQALSLDDIYIDLNTTTQVPLQGKSSRRQSQRDPGEETRALTALEAFTQSPRLALLGDPGSGKSTFVRQVLAWIATAHLTPRSVPSTKRRGSTPALPPGCPDDLFPLLLILRDLAPDLEKLSLTSLSAERQRQVLATAVRDSMVAHLQRDEMSSCADVVQQALTAGQCVLVLDGLDEVPPALRARVRDAVAAVVGVYQVARVIVTCRVRSYVGEALLPGFQAHTLAPFTEEQIARFATLWYQAQRLQGQMNAGQADGKAADLAQAAQSEALQELGRNPMTLTTMAIIHQRNVGLPRERVRLYALAVDVLLRRWQEAKMGTDGMVAQAQLVPFLRETRTLLPLVEVLAYEAQRSCQAGATVADVPRPAALHILEQPEYLGHPGLAGDFLDYVDHRAGLLVGRGGAPGYPDTYSFPHRVFQEYLAACYLVRQRDIVRTVFAHAQEGEFWGLVVQLAAEELLYNRDRRNEVLNLAYALCPATPRTDSAGQRAVEWSGSMAALLGAETICRDTGGPEEGTQYLERVRPRLLEVMRGALPAPERAAAGDALARLGDRRFREDAWYLPDEPLLGFVEIPAGEFWMGSDDKMDSDWLKASPRHQVTLPENYYIARYPVTVAQFQAFVTLHGYAWDGANKPQGALNHPVVHVTWYEALAYCAWLTERLQEWADLPAPLAALLRQEHWRVTLPGEAEWERAARSTDGRMYPWGNDKPDGRLANCEGILGATSAVGCFPAGASVEGVEECSGNVLEWTCSATDKYPYTVDRDKIIEINSENRRVLRGGAFWDSQRNARCAFRFRYDPRYRDHDAGFRLALGRRIHHSVL